MYLFQHLYVQIKKFDSIKSFFFFQGDRKKKRNIQNNMQEWVFRRRYRDFFKSFKWFLARRQGKMMIDDCISNFNLLSLLLQAIFNDKFRRKELSYYILTLQLLG